ncbi:MAG TPA: 2-C-methyl-D-erythritol 4-phosphate cytidylyltransferase [Actinomycetota bacterium]|nr:2-C-methyl-D-erythritol 4-phosphate cytidylyltransferase [Actinomycetota bacterium]
MRAAALLLAGGRGERLADVPKALVHVGDRSLVEWAVAAVEAAPEVEGFVVVLPAAAGLAVEAERIARAARSPKLLAPVPGGRERQDSVAAGLAALDRGFDAVLCHDVARPFASPALFARVLAALSGADGAVPVVPLPDTVKRVQGGLVVETVDRDALAAAQTPQAFRRSALEEAHRRAEAEGARATDDAALLERAGFRVAAVPGEPGNFKVTLPADLERARALAAAGALGAPGR